MESIYAKFVFNMTSIKHGKLRCIILEFHENCVYPWNFSSAAGPNGTGAHHLVYEWPGRVERVEANRGHGEWLREALRHGRLVRMLVFQRFEETAAFGRLYALI